MMKRIRPLLFASMILSLTACDSIVEAQVADPPPGDWFDVTDSVREPPVAAEPDPLNLVYEFRRGWIDRADVYEFFPELAYDGTVYIEAFISRDSTTWYNVARGNSFWAYWEDDNGLYVSVENAPGGWHYMIQLGVEMEEETD